jgi:hypothetical protein
MRPACVRAVSVSHGRRGDERWRVTPKHTAPTLFGIVTWCKQSVHSMEWRYDEGRYRVAPSTSPARVAET